MIRMLVVGYVFAIRSERELCREVQVNLAHRWFCELSIEDRIPDHSAFSRAGNERFRDSSIFRSVFERVVEDCIAAGLVGGDPFPRARKLGKHPNAHVVWRVAEVLAYFEAHGLRVRDDWQVP